MMLRKRGVRSLDRVRQNALRFGPPTAARRVSAANQPLSHRHILKRKPGFTSRLFFCMTLRKRGVRSLDRVRQNALRFGPPTAARRVSAANQALSHRHILKRKPGFASRLFFVVCGTRNPRFFIAFFCRHRAVRRSFLQSEHGLSGRSETQKLCLTGSPSLPIVAPRCSDEFATEKYGEVSEWLKEHAWKVCIRESVSRVRTPPSPPYSKEKA